MHPQWPIFADTHKSSRVIFRCIFGIYVFIKIILSPFSYNIYICILHIFTIKRDSLQCIPIFHIQNCNFSGPISIGHFRGPKTLTFKMRRGGQPFLWKWVLFTWEWKMISISKAQHLPSFWNRGPRELGNGLLNNPFRIDKIQNFFLEMIRLT